MSNGSGTWLRNLFFLFLVIQLAPTVFQTVKQYSNQLFELKTKVGIISIKGDIRDATHTIQEAKEFMEDPGVAAVILKIDSPGGTPGASQAAFSALSELKRDHKKPLIAWIQNTGASGAYYIACAADWIIATPSSLIGSVGVYLDQLYLKEFAEQFKVQVSVLRAGKFKGAAHPFLEQTPEHTKMLLDIINDISAQFKADVLKSRKQLEGLSEEIWAEGRALTGQEAFEIGMIDELGSPLTVEAATKRLAQITTQIEWVRPTGKSNIAKLLGGDDDESGSNPYINSFVSSFCHYLGIPARALSAHPNITLLG